ncbi:hypothetical protein O97_00885 [Bartonella henselae str. Zeus]|uniref:hypothetical protein n=1 Tax=Bartonella henselae TaxID=38323 RepID=UPI00049FBCCB|nr:hypothetical protein [Bartonella henselae]KEC57528.1 hypothetical protein O97_00885 [Bartonella henselae str. Zeus]
MKNVFSILITVIFIISQVVNVNAGFWNGAPQDSKTAFFIQQQNNAITQQYKDHFIQAVNIPFMLTPVASIGKEKDLFSEEKVEKVLVITFTGFMIMLGVGGWMSFLTFLGYKAAENDFLGTIGKKKIKS